MTKNQIDFMNHTEAVRHNREMERLTGESQAEQQRHNSVSERETNRANLAREGETARSNVQRETLTHETNVINATHLGRQDAEATRHNLATEAQERQKLWEQSRHNVATEAAQSVANLISGQNAATNAINAQTNQYRAAIDLYDASIREGQLGVSQQEADTRQYESETRRLTALDQLETGAAQRKSLDSQTRLNEQRRSESEANTQYLNERTQTERQTRLPGVVSDWAGAINDVGTAAGNVLETLDKPLRNLSTNIILNRIRRGQ